MGLHSFCAESGDQALEIGAREGWRFDVILADYRFGPGMSGIETAAEIATCAKRRISTLIVTGETEPNRIAEIHSSWFEMVQKPIMPDELARRMTSLSR